MNPADRSYDTLARDYVEAVQVMFGPTGQPSGERGARAPASYPDLEAQADSLAPLSEELTLAASELLADPDAGVRSQAEVRLLAKARSDLEISAYLLQAALDRDDQIEWAEEGGEQRSAAAGRATSEALPLLLPGGPAPERGVERGAVSFSDVESARQALAGAVDTTLMLVTERASRSGSIALVGLAGLGVGQVAQAAGVVGMDIAQALGKAEQVARLYVMFRGFALQAYESIVALLGPQVAQTVSQQILEWFKSIQEGEKFETLLKRVYQIERVNQDLKRTIMESQAALERFGAAVEAVEGLGGGYRQKIGLADDLLKKLKFLGFLPAAVLPQGRILLAAAYIALGGYVVLAGADYVDARRLKLLDRVPGVRAVVRSSLELGEN